MPHLDSHVAAVLDRAPAGGDEDVDEDDLIASLERANDDDAFREQRIQQLHAEFTRAKQMRDNDHGTFAEIKDEKTLMDITTSTKLCVVHFFKPDFNRCRIMNSHLEVPIFPLHVYIQTTNHSSAPRLWLRRTLTPGSYV